MQYSQHACIYFIDDAFKQFHLYLLFLNLDLTKNFPYLGNALKRLGSLSRAFLSSVPKKYI